jgi:hypothetical protein
MPRGRLTIALEAHPDLATFAFMMTSATKSLTSKNIALFGATGTAGNGAARALRAAGHTVTAYGRSDPQIDGIAFKHTTFDDVTFSKPYDAIVSCIASRTGAPKDAWRIDHDANIAIMNATKTAASPNSFCSRPSASKNPCSPSSMPNSALKLH